MSSPNADAPSVFVTLARAANCDACGRRLERGAHVTLVESADARRVRCDACVEGGRAPLAATPMPLALASTATLVRLPWPVWIAVGGLATVGAVMASRTVRRFALTFGVAAKGAARLVWARMRKQRNMAPIVVRESFERLGPTYVKLGQLVASSEGLFPERYCAEFQKCLDRVPPFAFADVEKTLREELGRDPAEVFSDLDPKPLASASIAQVHAARLKDGSDVVVKVQRPRIAELVAADLRILRGAAHLFAMLPHGELANPTDIVDDFGDNLAEELDFVREASNMDEFNRIMKEHHQDEVAAPRVMHELTSKRVLVMERFHGHRVDDVEAFRAKSIDGEAKLLVGMRAWFQSMIFHGFFHGDVHAGNLMSLDDGRIGFLDFGIVGRFSQERRSQVTEYLMSFSTGDFDKLASVMIAMGTVDSRSVNREALAKDLAIAYEPLLRSTLDSVKYADMIPAIMRVSVKHQMRLPRDFVLITKQMLYFDRYAKVLAPKLNIFRDPRVITALATDAMMAGLSFGPA
jgi:predicted unusual protein kinase regulating ubiquinone biosynthesis (AarF/ABC1/UbiB family)